MYRFWSTKEKGKICQIKITQSMEKYFTKRLLEIIVESFDIYTSKNFQNGHMAFKEIFFRRCTSGYFQFMHLGKCLEWSYDLQRIFFEIAIVVSFDTCIIKNFQNSRMASNEFFRECIQYYFRKLHLRKFLNGLFCIK